MENNRKRIGLLALVAATYCMVAGGPFGLEDLVNKAGYGGTILILALTALFWALPTALMVGEFSSALPHEGGFYVWVGRAMGPFWGFQEAWLTLVGSIFDMAIYPILFSAYLGHLFPVLGTGHMPLVTGAVMVATCVVWNLFGARFVGRSSVFGTILLLVPFAILVGYACTVKTVAASPATPITFKSLGVGILIAMWNFMGWDNAGTIAHEVENPRKTYVKAMLIAVTVVLVSYVIPIAAVWRTGLDPNSWTTGGWVDVAARFGGKGLAIAITLAGALAAMSTFNALVLSLSRLPSVLARDGFLPKLFAKENRRGVPVFAVIVFSAIWGACMTLGFERTVTLDILITGLSIVLEFVALVVLFVREPNLPRAFRIPGGLAGKILLGISPVILVGISILVSDSEKVWGVSALVLGAFLIFLGFPIYRLRRKPDSINAN